MKKKIMIALLGGSGKAGKYILRRLLEQNYHVRALLRSPDQFQITHDHLEIVSGDARDYKSLSLITEGCVALVSSLGQPVGEPLLYSTVASVIIRVLSEQKINRYVYLSGLNVELPGDERGEATQLATRWMQEHYPDACADRQREIDIIMRSQLDWTLIRLPCIHERSGEGNVHVKNTDCPGIEIDAGNIARFIAVELASGNYIRKAPFIANG